MQVDYDTHVFTRFGALARSLSRRPMQRNNLAFANTPGHGALQDPSGKSPCLPRVARAGNLLQASLIMAPDHGAITACCRVPSNTGGCNTFQHKSSGFMISTNVEGSETWIFDIL
jgi:hypothetical protein